MTKEIENRLNFGQVTLKYQYESAKERMRVHPVRASESLKIVEDFPHFESLEEALDFAQLKEKEKPFAGGKIMATIHKDEEFYYIGAPWLVASRKQIEAAEFVGLCFIADAHEVDDLRLR